MADETQADNPRPQVATPGRIVLFTPTADDRQRVGVVVGDAPEGGVDVFLLPTRYASGELYQAVRHADQDAEDDDPDDDAQPRTSGAGTWDWPPRV